MSTRHDLVNHLLDWHARPRHTTPLPKMSLEALQDLHDNQHTKFPAALNHDHLGEHVVER